MGTPHKLTSDTYQWRDAGDHPMYARTTYTCTRCNKVFVHHYNVDVDIHEAAKKVGFDIDYCSGVTDATKADSKQDACGDGLSEDDSS